MIKILYLRAPSDLQRGQVEITYCLPCILEMQREDASAKGTCLPWEYQELAISGVKAQLCCDPARVGCLQPLELWLLPPSQCRVALSLPWVCLAVSTEPWFDCSIFTLVQSPLWVILHKVQKSFTAFSFSAPSLLWFLFPGQFYSSWPSWTKCGEHDLSEILLHCFPSPWNEGLLFPPRKV